MAAAAGIAIWGPGGITDNNVLKRWFQGFEFSPSEPVALVQYSGGPCGVLAPVQGFPLRNLLFDTRENRPGDWRNPKNADTYLVYALADILETCAAGIGRFTVALVDPVLSTVVHTEEPNHYIELLTKFTDTQVLETASSRKELEDLLSDNLLLFKSPFGVLMLMYSAVLTRGVDNIAADASMDEQPLISLPFGHANQSLINLMLCGIATPHVWDGDKDAGGLIMRGITQQAPIGYLTLLESLKYCEVGTYLKNPKHPIWVVGSETHMTLLFSLDERLVIPDSPKDVAMRVFAKHDVQGNGFIPKTSIPSILAELNMPQNADTVTQQMIGVQGGIDDIILLSSFEQVLFGQTPDTGPPNDFVVYHYNGIAGAKGEVRFLRGVAKASAPMDFGSPDVMRCLRTKWSQLQVAWENDSTPSII